MTLDEATSVIGYVKELWPTLDWHPDLIAEAASQLAAMRVKPTDARRVAVKVRAARPYPTVAWSDLRTELERLPGAKPPESRVQDQVLRIQARCRMPGGKPGNVAARYLELLVFEDGRDIGRATAEVWRFLESVAGKSAARDPVLASKIETALDTAISRSPELLARWREHAEQRKHA